jgi:predicted ArsR family transcriptional regulator
VFPALWSLPVKPITSVDDPRYVQALAHPARARILALLRDHQASPKQLSQKLGLTLGATAYHVRSLVKVGLLDLVDETRVRGAVEHHYRARALPLRSETSTATGVEASLRAIEDHTEAAAAAGGFDGPEALLARVPARVDARGWTALGAESRKFLERVAKLEGEAAKRIAQASDGVTVREAGVVVLTFESIDLATLIPASKRKVRARPAPRRSGGSRQEATREGILQHLRRRNATIAQLAEARSLSAATVRAVVRDLQEEQLIAVVGDVPSPSGRGRHAQVYGIRS